jgi:hypothetical protein
MYIFINIFLYFFYLVYMLNMICQSSLLQMT